MFQNSYVKYLILIFAIVINAVFWFVQQDSHVKDTEIHLDKDQQFLLADVNAHGYPFTDKKNQEHEDLMIRVALLESLVADLREALRVLSNSHGTLRMEGHAN